MVLYNFSSNRPTEGRAIIRPLTVAFGEGAATIGYSIDGINWNACNVEAFSIRANHGCWNGKVWVGVGIGGNWVATSYDGINWTGQDNSILSEGYYVAWNGTVFLAAGVANISTPNNTFATSTDGFLWTAVSTDVFYSGYANWVGWTENVWCATGSGNGNTSATSTSITAASNWSGGNIMVTDLSSIVTDMVCTYSSSSGNAQNAFDKTSNSSLEWRTSSASYDYTGSPTNCSFSTAIGNSLNTVSGEFLQISTPSPVIIDYYLMLFNISVGGDALYETPRSWYLLGANVDNPDYWDIIDIKQIALSNPPSYGPNGYYAVPCVLNNSISYQYYRILVTSTFNDNSFYKSYYARIMEIDLFYSCPTTSTISSRIKPIITPNGISYPVKMNNYYFIYADRTNTPISPAIQGISYYNTDISSVTDITCSAYDGLNCIICSKTNLFYTSDFGKTWNITNVNSDKIGMQMYGAAFNGNYFIIGGGNGVVSGNVLIYGKSENGMDNWYQCINAKNVFTKVNGVSSNSGYGYTVPNNSVYFDLGDKMNIVTPKAYPVGGGDIQHCFNLNTFPVSF